MLARAWAWLANLGLQRRIQLLTIVGLLVIFAFFWLGGRRAVEESTQQGLNNQLAIASLVASSLDHRLNSALTLLETTATQLDSSLEGSAHLPQFTQQLRDAQLQLSAYGGRLFWLDTSGNVLWTEPFDASLLSKPFPDFPAVRPALEKGARHVSDLRQPLDSSQPYVLLAVPVFRPEGEIGSLLIEEISTDQLGLKGVLNQVTTGESTHIEVVDHEGTILASSLPELGSQSKGGYTDQFTRLIDSQQPMVGECHQCPTRGGEQSARRTQEILAFAPLSAAPWGVAVRQPISDVMAPISYLLRHMLLGGGVVLVAALLITWFITRQIVEPIQALDDASAQFAAGNLDVSLPHGGIDEIARLTANLEQMRVRLEAILEDHRRWNEALEEMVEERTRELSALYEQLQGREVMCKRLLGKVLTTQEEERARLARELHDSIGQSLTAIIMTTTAVENSLPDGFISGKEKLVNVRTIAAQSLQDLRNLIFDLRPEVLDDLGLALALRSQAKKCLEPAGVRMHLRAAGLKDQLPAEVETAVFRVVQEAVTNIARHAQASEAHISLTKKDDRLIVRIEDDGVGFDPALVMSEGRKGWGLRGMEERTTLLGGKFYIGSQPGSGTLVLAEIPLGQD
jgi:signal transduction histidine kinase